MLAKVVVFLATVPWLVAEPMELDVTLDHVEFSNRLQSEHLGVIFAAFVLTLILIVVTSLWCVTARRVRLSVVLMLVMTAALLTVGIVAWFVTYATPRDVIEETQESHLAASVTEAIEKVRSELDPAVRIIELTKEHSQEGKELNLLSQWPVPHYYLSTMLDTVGSASSSLHMLYYGTAEGRLMGVSKYGGEERDVDCHNLCVLPGDALPEWVLCPAKDYQDYCNCSDAVERQDCLLSCGAASPSAENCYGSERSLRYIITRVKNSRLVHKSGRTNHRFDDPKIPNIPSIQRYDPRQRPWYNISVGNVVWSAPYIFSSGGVGITAVARVVSRQGAHIGTIAVDVTAQSLQDIIMSLRPTDSALSILMTAKGCLLGSSFTKEALQIDSGVDIGGVMEIARFSEKSKIKGLLAFLLDRYGSIENAMKHKAILMSCDHGVLSFPFRILGGLELILVMEVPYNDMMGHADRTSMVALVLAVSISLGSAVVVFLFVRVLLQPLDLLADDMGDVVLMKLQTHGPPRRLSSISEVAGIQIAFHTMALSLSEYRQYLPQSVLCNLTDIAEPEETTLEPEPERADPLTPPRSSSSSPKAVSSEFPTDGTSGSQSSGELTPSRGGDLPLMSATLRAKCVSLVIVNLHNFNGLARSLTSRALAGVYSKYLEPIVSTARTFRGIVDEYSGDHVYITFNTTLESSMHRNKAVECCLALLELFSKKTFKELSQSSDEPTRQKKRLRTNLVAGSGRALCGNMGCSGLKRYSVIGSCASYLRVLERWGAHWGAGIVVDGAIGDDLGIATSFERKKLCRVTLREEDTRVRSLYEIVKPFRGVKAQEWMYQLERVAEEAKYRQYNNAVDLLYEAKFDDAFEALETCDLPHFVSEELHRWITACQLRDEPPPPLHLFSVPRPHAAFDPCRSPTLTSSSHPPEQDVTEPETKYTPVMCMSQVGSSSSGSVA